MRTNGHMSLTVPAGFPLSRTFFATNFGNFSKNNTEVFQGQKVLSRMVMGRMKWLLLLLAVVMHVVAFKGFMMKPRVLKVAVPAPVKSLCPTMQPLWSTATAVEPEQYKFESNVARVMDIIINSLYSNKDVFIRELVSNAADACDKKRFTALTNGLPSENLHIRISANREKNTLTIEDTGIGMNKEELIQNLGKIAESGTKRFMDNIGNKKDDVSLIGQFGVGFYSGFLVANRIEVITKGSNGEQLRWEAKSDSIGEYTIAPSDASSEPIESSTGTRIILHLKDECDQYLDDVALRALLEKYSEFIPFPIELQRNVTRPQSIADPTQPVEADGTIPMKTTMTKTLEWSVVNDKKPLWMRTPKSCTEDEYTEFYKQTFKAYDHPLAYTHFSMEGNIDFKSLLYIPSELPYELTKDIFSNIARSIRLYVKRVYINDKFEDLLPRWLLFLRGIVDSDDIQLNVSREILQKDRSLRIIKQRLIKKSIEMFHSLLLNHPSKFLNFWKNYGKYIKIGIIEDEKYRDDLLPLCHFYSSHSKTNVTSLNDYILRMKPKQKNIYYIMNENLNEDCKNPVLEKLKDSGYEVLYLTEPIDEMTLQNIEKYQDKPIIDAAKEISSATSDLLTDEERQSKQHDNDNTEKFRDWLKNMLGNRVNRVEASTRLIRTPAILIQSEYGVSPSMQKYIQAHNTALNDEKNKLFHNMFNQAVLEINLKHPIITALKSIYEAETVTADTTTSTENTTVSTATAATTTTNSGIEGKEMVEILFNTAALAAGYTLENTVDYSERVINLLTKLC